MSELHHECGLAAVYQLDPRLAPREQGPRAAGGASRWMPNMLLDMQNRGQLAAGMTTYDPHRKKLLLTYKDIGSVNEVFRLAHRGKRDSLMRRYAGMAAIGHVRYATCGADDRNNAQPFERRHLQRSKWFSIAFNGQLANYDHLKAALLADEDHHLSRDTDTEIILHLIARLLSERPQPDYVEMMRRLSEVFDGAYSLALLDAQGVLVLARDPLGIKPLCYVEEKGMFAAASESVALVNLGFDPDSVKSVEPGSVVIVSREHGVRTERFVDGPPQRAHCFFEWIYFANVASTLDERSVYLSRTALGEELAELERSDPSFQLDEDTIVVPVPDTSKPAADAMAHVLQLPCREGLIRNRYSGRTFIEGREQRIHKAASKYTPLREVLHGKRVILVEDSIVRSTTMRALLGAFARKAEPLRFMSAWLARRSSRPATTASTCRPSTSCSRRISWNRAS